MSRVGLVKEERLESTKASAFGNMFYSAELIDFKKLDVIGFIYNSSI